MSSEYLRLYETFPQPCSYLAGRENTAIVTDPAHPISTMEYAVLMDQGFRRSGGNFYRPHCRGCDACVSVRIPVLDFRPRRGQRRIWQRNQDLQVQVETPHFHIAHWQLYQKYQHGRHAGGGMDTDSLEDYERFVLDSPVETWLVSFRTSERLLAVSVVDVLPQGMSAVYTFYDPEEQHRGLGVHAVLWQVQRARELGLPYVYLGYWIAECDKMAYKTQYQPLEGWIAGNWQAVPDHRKT
ncbi:arginyltransferase [Thermithiobacillus plumbiphilus]|uniref:Aspartate/glutamate leucyltransferase n=1 Tax=Thermithiobacillus plumbiphilus TaxID=1729899 RepID=A0ABU9DA87_9PROT